MLQAGLTYNSLSLANSDYITLPICTNDLTSCRLECAASPSITTRPSAASPATMFAARQRAGCVARQLQRTARSYASESHGHHPPAGPVNESFGVRSPCPPKAH